MALRAFLLTLLCVIWAGGSARAQDWRIADVAGAARAFAAGEWTPLPSGGVLTPNAIVETLADGRVRLAGAALALDIPENTKLRADSEADPLLRLFAGGLGVEASAPVIVMTTYVAAETADASFAVVAEPFGSTIVVRRGSVKITDLTTRETVMLHEGQILRVRPGQATLTLNAPRDQSALATAQSVASGRFDAQTLNSKIALVDNTPTGAIAALHAGGPANSAAGARLAEEAADAAHAERRKGKIGKADPRAVAAVARLAKEMFGDLEVEVEPWDESFQWTEVEHGEVRLKPIWRIILALGGAKAFEFWFLAFVSCLFLGAVTHAIMDKAGFGLGGNMALVMAAFATALLIRDLFFRAGAYLAIEPFLSIGMMLSAMTLLLLSGAFAKYRLP